MRVTKRPSPPDPPQPDARIDEYAIVERIAVGGMAEVFRASAPASVGAARTVVIKRMLPSLASEASARAMFQEEARLGRLIAHPNVVRVLGSGEASGLPYLVLEHVPGLDLFRLTRWLAREGRVLGPELALRITHELLAALHAVHNTLDEAGQPLGLVHRDVSPSNVLLSNHGDVKLGDFGIARALLSESFPQAAAGARGKGKLGYLSPEQVAGQAADRRADVFAAAVIATELLTGRPLYTGSTELAILLAIRDGDLRTLDDAAALPPPLVQALRRGLAQLPEERTASALELDASLEEAARASGIPSARDAAIGSTLAGIVAEAMRARGSSGLYAAEQTVDDDLRTPRPSELFYRVRTHDGRLLGPWTYATLVEAVATGEVGADDEVASAGEPFERVRTRADVARHMPPSSLDERTQRYAVPSAPDARYDIAEGGVGRSLARVLLAAETGLLLFEQGSVRKELYVVDGTPEFVSSNLASELLGEFLVARGVISRGELDMALAVMPRFEGKLGDTLTALGLVEPVHLVQQISSQVQEKLLDLFTWERGEVSFFRGIARPPSGFRLGLDPWRILEEGVDRRLSAGLDAHHERATFQAARPAPRGLAHAPLSASARQLLDQATRPVAFSDFRPPPPDRLLLDPRLLRREVALLVALGALDIVA